MCHLLWSWHPQSDRPVCIGIAEELTIAAEKAGLELEQLAGMSYDLTRSRWRLTEDVCVNYIAYYQRTGLAELKQP